MRLSRTIGSDEDLRRGARAGPRLGRGDRGLRRGLVRDAHSVQGCSAEDAPEVTEHQAAQDELSKRK